MRIFLALVLAGAVAFGVYWRLTAVPVVTAVTAPAFTPDLANGRTTFNAAGCSSCHAVPGQPDRTRLGGGLAIPSPFGTFYAPNISPDPNDGIGKWSEADFVTAVIKGTSPDGRHYFPSFPYTSYQRMRIEDVLDLLRIRLGSSFTIAELAQLYGSGTDWADDVARRRAGSDSSAVVDAAFNRYAREATDFAGGKQRFDDPNRGRLPSQDY